MVIALPTNCALMMSARCEALRKLPTACAWGHIFGDRPRWLQAMSLEAPRRRRRAGEGVVVSRQKLHARTRPRSRQAVLRHCGVVAQSNRGAGARWPPRCPHARVGGRDEAHVREHQHARVERLVAIDCVNALTPG